MNPYTWVLFLVIFPTGSFNQCVSSLSLSISFHHSSTEEHNESYYIGVAYPWRKVSCLSVQLTLTLSRFLYLLIFKVWEIASHEYSNSVQPLWSASCCLLQWVEANDIQCFEGGHACWILRSLYPYAMSGTLWACLCAWFRETSVI